MDSPLPRRRDWKPLQPVNYSRMEPNSSDQMKQKLMETSACDGEKENGLMVDSAAIRLRKERMRMERERTEEVLTKRERELESRVKEMERRDEELRRLEMEIHRLIKVKDRQSSSKILPHLRSLRAKEEEKKITLGF